MKIKRGELKPCKINGQDLKCRQQCFVSNIFPRRVSVVLEVRASQSQLERKWEPVGQATDKSFADISELERIL